MLESTTYKFAKANQKEFGIIPDVTDRNYITNSYHVNVREEIDAFTKLSLGLNSRNYPRADVSATLKSRT